MKSSIVILSAFVGAAAAGFCVGPGAASVGPTADCVAGCPACACAPAGVSAGDCIALCEVAPAVCERSNGGAALFPAICFFGSPLDSRAAFDFCGLAVLDSGASARTL